MSRPWYYCTAIPVWQPTAAVLVVILYLTLMPQPLNPDDGLFPHADKVVHFIMFGTLTGTIIYDRWRTRGPVSRRFALSAACISIILGIAVEWLQDLMELGRSGRDGWDILANTLGALTALPICRSLKWTAFSRKQPAEKSRGESEENICRNE